MSIETVFHAREAFPVSVNGCTVYCENFKAAAVRAVSEETTVNGKSIVTSSGLRGTRLTFSGRIQDIERPLGFLADISSEMTENSEYTVVYRGLSFGGCILCKYEITDSGKNWTDVSMTLITFESAQEVET